MGIGQPRRLQPRGQCTQRDEIVIEVDIREQQHVGGHGGNLGHQPGALAVAQIAEQEPRPFAGQVGVPDGQPQRLGQQRQGQPQRQEKAQAACKSACA